MNTKNLAIITGNLGKDPIIKRFDNGGGVASFSLATSETYKNKAGEKVTETDWHNCQVFYNFETIETYVKKGDALQVVGSLKNKEYTDKDGNKRTFTFVKVDSFSFIGGKKESSNSQAESVPDSEDDSQLPF